MLAPVIFAALCAVWVSQEAAKSTGTGLDPANRLWFYVLALPALFGTVLIASVLIAERFVGTRRLPLIVRRVLRPRPQYPPAMTAIADAKPSHLRAVRAAAGLALQGMFLVLLAVPVQVMLTTWLVVHPEFFLPWEAAAVAVESGVAVVWLVYLVYSVVAGYRPQTSN